MVSEVTTASPFGITWSYSPRMGVEPAETTAPAAKDFAVIFNKVVEALEKAKLSMKVQADKHRNPALDYKVGQQVWFVEVAHAPGAIRQRGVHKYAVPSNHV